MNYSINKFFKGIMPYVIGFLLVLVIFRVLVYAIPAVFIIWAVYKIVQKLKHIKMNKFNSSRKTYNKRKVNYVESSSNTGNYSVFNENKEKIIDVEYEEILR